MKKNKATVCLILFTLALTLAPLPIHAYDLFIDIEAINRMNQAITGPQATARFGEHLFTEDAQRVNEALAAQILRRQESYLYLFEAPLYMYQVDPRARIANAAASAALFAAPTDFGHINIPQEPEPLAIWIMAAALAACAIAGFLFTLAARRKKRGRAQSVH